MRPSVVLLAAGAFVLAAAGCRSSVVSIPVLLDESERSPRESRIAEALREAYDARYDEALRSIDAIAAEDPDDPDADLARAHVHLLRALLSGDASGDDSNTRALAAAAEAALLKAERRLDRDGSDRKALRDRGYARSYAARAQFLSGNSIRAVFGSQGGAADLAASLRGAPDADADPFLFIGFFHYMAGLAPPIVRAVSSLLNVTGDCDLGRAEIEHAARHGFLYRDEAALTLAFIGLLDREADYERSLDLLSDLVARYPMNAGFALVLHLAQRRAEDYEGAEATLRSLLARDPETLEPSIVLGTRVLLAALVAEKNRLGEAEETLESILALEGKAADRVRGRAALALGLVAERRGDRARAVALYEEARDGIESAFQWDRDDLRREVEWRRKAPISRDEIELRFVAGEERRGDAESTLAAAAAMRARLAEEGRLGGESDGELFFREARAALALGDVAAADLSFRAAAACEGAAARVRGAARYDLGRLLLSQGRPELGRAELASLVDAPLRDADVRSRSRARNLLLLSSSAEVLAAPAEFEGSR